MAHAPCFALRPCLQEPHSGFLGAPEGSATSTYDQSDLEPFNPQTASPDAKQAVTLDLQVLPEPAKGVSVTIRPVAQVQHPIGES